MRTPLCALALAGALLTACQPASPALHGSPYDPPADAPDFELNTNSGQALSLEGLAGHPTLLYFGFTSCPDFCPVVLADLKWAFEELGPEAQAARVLFVTVDPETDTDERMTTYLERFNPAFIGARAQDEAGLQAMLSDYGAYASSVAEAGHQHAEESSEAISHTSRIFLIDAQGRLRTNYEFGTPREQVLADLRTLLSEP